MSARNRGGIHGAIPWVALIVVTIFAFSQLRQRNQARAQATKARDDLRAAEGVSVLKMPTEVQADAAEALVEDFITEREKQLDTALQAALEVTRADTKRIASLLGERDGERRRAERLAGQHASEASRAEELAVRCASLGAEVESGARKVREAGKRAQACEEAADNTVSALEKHLDATNAQFEATYERIVEQLAASTVALSKAERALGETSAAMRAARARAETAVRGKKAGEKTLAALRKRLIAAVIAQLASEDPTALVTGARMVGLLGMSGSALRLLALTDHDDPLVASAAARGLAGARDLPGVALEASGAALALMADDAIGARMAGLHLLRAVTGKQIEFDAGASPAVRAAAWKKLAQQLGS